MSLQVFTLIYYLLVKKLDNMDYLKKHKVVLIVLNKNIAKF